MKKVLCSLLSLMMAFTLISLPMDVHAASEVDMYAAEILGYYKAYQDDAATDVERLLAKMESVDAQKAAVWSEFMDAWKHIKDNDNVNVAGRNDEGKITRDELPASLLKENSGIADNSSTAIVILGQGLTKDSDGNPAMKDELVGRIQVGLALANEYPNTYVLVTGGDVQNVGITEAEAMGNWFIEQGLDENRLILEKEASSTINNAKKSVPILVEKNITSIIMVTSDYHIQRGSMCFNSAIIKNDASVDSMAVKIVANCGYDTANNYEAFSQQADAIKSITGINPASGLGLSVLESLTVTLNSAYVQGEELNITVKANYNTDFSKDVTDEATITGFDSSLGADQTVTVSYTEHGVTMTGQFTLSETSKDIVDYAGKINALLEEADAVGTTTYTPATLEVLNYAVANAEAVLADADATEKEMISAITALKNALEGLETRVNIALHKSAEVSHASTSNGPVNLTNGSTGDYWCADNVNNKNIPIEDTYFVIDLEGIYAVEAVNVVPYFVTNNRYYQYDVLLSEDKESWTTVAQYRGTEITTEAGQTFELSTPVNARYLKVQGVYVYVVDREDINNFHVTEVRAYGDLVQEIAEEPVKTKENLALYRKVTLNGNASGKVLTDGKIVNTYTNSGTAIQNSYAIVELPTDSTVEEVRVVTYYNNLSKWYTWEVLVSSDMNTWTSVGAYTTESNPGNAGHTIVLDEPQKASYVKIQGLKTNNTNLHLVEIEVYGTFDNIAKEKPVTTTFGSSSAAKLVDGVITNSSYWSPGDFTWATLAPENRPYAVIDLDGVYALDYMSVMTYIDKGRYYQFEVHTSVDGVTYTEFGVKNDTVVSDEMAVFKKDTPVRARYIKVIATLNSANTGFHMVELQAHGEAVIEQDADYTAVNTAKNSVPSDLSLYTADTVTALKIALAKVKTGLKESQQIKVDGYANAINAAVAALVYKDADYSAVKTAVASAKALNKNLYVDFTAVETAVAAVVEGKNITEQSVVDGYADAINAAIEALQYKPADYSAVEEAMDKVPADTSLYTSESVEALTNAINAVVEGKNITEQAEVDAMAGAIEAAVLALQYKDADYTKINEAKAKIPSDLSVYTEGSVADLEAAIAMIEEGLDITKQAQVDAVVEAIETAIENLKYKPADYSAVETALAAAEALNKDLYTNFDAVETAVAAVVEGKNITEQAEVDAMAEAINAAIEALQYKPADYSDVEEAIAKVPADLTLYTEESVAALQVALDAVVEGKNITEQAEVDAMAGAVEAAVLALQYKDADYEKINEAKDKIPADLSIYTDETVAALEAAVSAVEEDLDITKQDEVDAYAAAIEQAIENLELKPADYTAVNAALAKIPSDLDFYTTETVEALEAAIALIEEDLDITKQAEVNAMAKAVEDAVDALVKKTIEDDTVASKLIFEFEMREVPSSLTDKYETVEQLQKKMASIVVSKGAKNEASTVLFDVTLVASFDGGQTWVEVTEDQWPASGKLRVFISYAELDQATGVALDDSYEYTVAHMFTSTAFGKTPGKVETPAVTKTSSGIEFYVTGLSPVMVGWKLPENNTVVTPTTPAPAEPAIPNTGDSSSTTGWALTAGMALLALLALKKRRNQFN